MRDPYFVRIDNVQDLLIAACWTKSTNPLVEFANTLSEKPTSIARLECLQQLREEMEKPSVLQELSILDAFFIWHQISIIAQKDYGTTSEERISVQMEKISSLLQGPFPLLPAKFVEKNPPAELDTVGGDDSLH